MNNDGVKSLFDLCWCKRLSTNKAFEFQMYWCGGFNKWFGLDITWTRRCDHAGFTFRLELFWLYLCVQIYDSRHWNYDENRYCVYGDTDEIINSIPEFNYPQYARFEIQHRTWSPNVVNGITFNDGKENKHFIMSPGNSLGKKQGDHFSETICDFLNNKL